MSYFEKKNWKDRVSEYPSRRTLTNVTTQEQTVVTFQRNEGTISESGDAFSASNMNALENRIESAFESAENVDTATLTTGGWTTSAPYTQTINVITATSDSTPIISMGMPSPINSANVKTMKKNYGYIDRVVSGTGTLTFYCYNKRPVVNINVLIKGV